jgi:hypothetical protein
MRRSLAILGVSARINGYPWMRPLLRSTSLALPRYPTHESATETLDDSGLPACPRREGSPDRVFRQRFKKTAVFDGVCRQRSRKPRYYCRNQNSAPWTINPNCCWHCLWPWASMPDSHLPGKKISMQTALDVFEAALNGGVPECT